MKHFKPKPLVALTAASLIAVGLSGCMGDDDDNAKTLGGTAAIGVPIVDGTVNVSCAGGSALSPVKTTTSGAWKVTLSGQTLPCAVQVNGGTVGDTANTTPYHSIAFNVGTVNITPLTDMVVANFATRSDLSTWFSGLSANTISQFNSTALNTAINKVTSSIPGLNDALGSSNPFTTAFTATNGNAMDDILEAISAAISGAKTNYSAMVAAMSGSTITLPGTGFNFSYTAPSTGGGGTSGTPGTLACTDTEIMTFSKGAVRSPTADELAGYFRSYTGSFDHAGDNSYPEATATLNADGTVSVAWNGGQKTYTGTSFCYDTTIGYEPAGNTLYVNFGTEGKVDLWKKSGEFSGYAQATSGSGGSGAGSEAGTSTLKIEVTVAGVTTTQTLTNIPKPTNQDDFCGAVNSGEYGSLSTALGGQGTLTINSCSFTDSVGQISATMSLTSPIAFSTSYSVKYTYE